MTHNKNTAIISVLYYTFCEMCNYVSHNVSKNENTLRFTKNTAKDNNDQDTDGDCQHRHHRDWVLD